MPCARESEAEKGKRRRESQRENRKEAGKEGGLKFLTMSPYPTLGLSGKREPKENKREQKEERERERGGRNERKDDTLARVCMCDCVWVWSVGQSERERARPVCGFKRSGSRVVGGRAGERKERRSKIKRRAVFPAEASFLHI